MGVNVERPARVLKHQVLLAVFFSCFLVTTYAQAGPLHEAVTNGDYKRVVQLVSSGADVNEKDDAGSTPLFWSAGIGHIDITSYLISKGADVNAEFIYGGTPLNAAVVGGGEEHRQIIAILLKNGADINLVTGRGTPLHGAVSGENIDMINFLIKNGADINARGGDGLSTPLDRATISKSYKIITLLKSHGARCRWLC